MTGQAGLLELSAGLVLRLDGVEWAVEAIEAQLGRVLLRTAGGERSGGRSGGWPITVTISPFRCRPRRPARPGSHR